VIGTCGADTYLWEPPSGFSEDFLYVADIELFKVPTKMFHKGKTYNLLLLHLYKSSFMLIFNLSLNDFYFC
jgi:hypothetical protein